MKQIQMRNLRNTCAYCGKRLLIKNKVCFSCKRKIPSGFSLKASKEEIVNEINRNEALKAIFKKTTSIGSLYFDTDKNLFHIDNGYFNVNELASYSFYPSEPRYNYGLFGHFKVVTDIYFSYTLIGQERRVRCIKKAEYCRYENTGKSVCVDPPISMQMANHTFKDMIDREYDKVIKAIELAKMKRE